MRSITSTRCGAIDAVRETGSAIAEVAMCYTGRPVGPRRDALHPRLPLRMAEEIVDAGAHSRHQRHGRVAAGCPRRVLVTALRSRFDLPVHIHTHDTPGGQLATYVAAWHYSGADAVDGAAAPLAGTASQPALSSIVAAAARYRILPTPACRCRRCATWNRTGRHYEGVRLLIWIARPTGRVYTHEDPGGQLSKISANRRSRSVWSNRFGEIESITLRPTMC